MRKLPHLLILMSLAITSMAQTDGWYTVRHSWDCDGKNYSIELEISEELYDYYQNEREHLAYHFRIEDAETPVNFYSFILSDYDRPFIRELARRFSDRAFTDLDKVKLAMTFVQSLPYAFDDDSKGEEEYVRYPIETLVDGSGDCEDKVALLGAILYEMDIDFVLLSLPEHLALAVRCEGVLADRYVSYRNKKYYYVETTMEGWEVGQVPPDYAFSEMEVYSNLAEPTVLVRELRFESAAARASEKVDCALNLQLHNLGPGRATGLQVHVWVYEGSLDNAKVIANEVFHLDDLLEGQRRDETLSFRSLIKEKAKLYLELTGENFELQHFDLPLHYSKTTHYNAF
ncbi:MAG: hypothetical protein IJQ11_09710 [Bacteroidales bacterium]|nr:hypothetical protein [Bacteroidales bacterium]